MQKSGHDFASGFVLIVPCLGCKLCGLNRSEFICELASNVNQRMVVRTKLISPKLLWPTYSSRGTPPGSADIGVNKTVPAFVGFSSSGRCLKMNRAKTPHEGCRVENGVITSEQGSVDVFQDGQGQPL